MALLRCKIFILLGILAVSMSVVSASMYRWRDKNGIVQITNVRPEWWIDEMDNMETDEIIAPEETIKYPGKFVGDNENRKFHRPTCEQIYTPDKKMAIPDQKIIWFESYEDALSQGYFACDHCKPKATEK